MIKSNVKRFRWMSLGLVFLATLFSAVAFLLLSPTAGEPFYMMSCLFLFMAGFCALR